MGSIYKNMTNPEREVADYFKEIDLWWVFEFPVFVWDDGERPRLFTPDFYLPKLGLFVEVCGSKEFDYEYRKMVYEKNGIPVVFLHYYKNRAKWKSFLEKSIMDIEQQRKSEAGKLADFQEQTSNKQLDQQRNVEKNSGKRIVVPYISLTWDFRLYRNATMKNPILTKIVRYPILFSWV